MDDLLIYDLNAAGDQLSQRAIAEIKRLRTLIREYETVMGPNATITPALEQ